MSKHSLQLCNFNDLPDWQKDNPLIVNYYVRETNSLFKSLCSIFLFHSESMNIFTHLIPALLYAKFTYNAITTLEQVSYPIVFYLISVIICFLLSSLFHLFKCTSVQSNEFWGKLDYVGISLLINATIVSMALLGFNESRYTIMKNTFVTQTSCLTAYVIILAIKSHPKQGENEDDNDGTLSEDDDCCCDDHKGTRAKLFASLGLSGLIPVITGLYIYGPKVVYYKINIPMVIASVLCYIVGTLIYVFKIPEKFYPGRFDLVGSSHQLFHIFIVFGTVCHYHAIQTAKNFALNQAST
ncbi:hypothetical protein TBLA_0B08255 [Henningerozyma blattae CBS 6284]|uniref:Uncharacterized protein n=1 Tax=Henningerozyma blattae (strain ATCC 34711 / CBS 6284 / DSM 70876 / NBRC 10599 / NRRL Y-10934 / UCD 77-7) TaxID=1071380 RepID=I2GZT9_HENB6|nr:hypothetical protein TBLA_0B08255 [Tetrapisispora blattae CBS 6284]CCH59641.1 hypothetical protein TBLA_0B08255 [Tetrapisispora blattae CBS 6284]